ncbi:MAG: STAS domain-containing protein [Sedimentisphaerales bacterium]|nr:STAS domain-containing protein [Sedimentisphaerales bacterium]
MKVITNNEGAVTILKPLGPLLAGELDELDKSLNILVRDWTRRIVINMTESGCIDSAGLELINRYHQQLGEHGLRLKLCGMSELVRKIFNLTRLSHRLEIYPDTAAAVRSFV